MDTAADTTTDSREIFSPIELARYLGVGRTTAYELMRDGSIPSFTVRALRRVRRKDVDRFIQKRMDAASKNA